MRRLAAVLGLAVAASVFSGCAAPPGPSGDSQAASGTVETSALDGIYRWSTTIEQTRGTAADGAEFVVPTSTSLIVAPDTFTLSLEDGEWSMITTATPRHDGGTFTADGGVLDMEWTILPAGEGPYRMTYRYTVADDGGVTLAPIGSTDPVDAFVFSASPWTKIG